MEYSSSCDDEDFILKFSDDECSNKMDYADNYGIIDDTQRDSHRCESSQLKVGFAQPKQENDYEFNYVKFNQIGKKKNGIVVDDDNEQKFASRYLTSSAVSPEKQQEISQNFEKVNISDKMVNFSKLINQLFNAKVVIEKMRVNAGTINEQPAMHRASSKRSRFRVSVQLYCPECQIVIVIGSDGGTVKKSCSKCESPLKYLCSNCNSKHYKTYKTLTKHLKACGLPDSTLVELKPSNFLVKKTEIDFSKAIICYCSSCNEIDSICGKWTKNICRNCNRQLLYQCSKCKAQYNATSALLYHMQTQCYPGLHKCRQCDFMSQAWERMRQHVIQVHLRVLSNIEPPTQVQNTVSQTVGNHTNVDLLDEKGETNCNEYAKLYCPMCKKTKFAHIKDALAKNCSDCKTAMTFLCTKCNVKHYKRYPYLQFHLDRCKKNGDDMNTLDDDNDCARLNMKDKNVTQLVIDRSHFITKEIQYVNATEKWTRYCPKCGLLSESHNNRRCTCSENLLYMCKKCNVKCNNHSNMGYHSEKYCFPTHQYKCTQCEYPTTSWKSMKIHFKFTHADQPLLKCESCPYETKHAYRLKDHTKRIHCKIANKFDCGSCSYSSKYKRNLQRHEKLDH